MRSVRWRLVLALVLVAWVSVATVGAATARLTADRFTVYVRHGPGMMSTPQMRAMMQAVLGAPERQFLRDMRRATWLAALLGLGVAAVVGTLTARQITAPLRRLADAARRIGSGDLSARVPLASGDEIGEVAQTFNAMVADLRQAEADRRQLVADIAHELGTPLAVLQANVEGMLDGVIQATPDKLAALDTQVRVLSRLVKDLRDLSLAQQGRLPLDRRSVDLAALVREVAEVSRPVAEEKGITLLVDGGAPVTAWADRDRTAQVLHNLLANALRYTDAGGTIRVAVTQVGAAAQVEVADTGPGIPPEELPRIFERFHRVDRSRSRATGGAGLGLAIVKHLVEAHGGRVWVSSRPGEGSTFGFSLPTEQPVSSIQHPASSIHDVETTGRDKT